MLIFETLSYDPKKWNCRNKIMTFQRLMSALPRKRLTGRARKVRSELEMPPARDFSDLTETGAVRRFEQGYLPQRFNTAFVTASRTASWRIAH